MYSPQTLEVLAVIGLFMVRFGVPLLVSAGVAFWLFRLDTRWSREAPKLAPFVTEPASAENSVQGNIISEPCWVFRACPENVREKCPAYLHAETACWLCRLRTDGRLASGCRCCSIFATSHIPAQAAD